MELGPEFDETIVGIWFVTIPDGDMLASVSRLSARSFKLVYRFRYYDKEKTGPFDGKDKKNWYEGIIKDSDEAQVIESITTATKILAAAGDNKRYELLRGSKTFEEFKAAFFKLPFVHARQATDAELAEMNRHERRKKGRDR